MARRSVLTSPQRSARFHFRSTKRTCCAHCTLSDEDLEHVEAGRRSRKKLVFALQLCVLRYPGRLLAPGEFVPPPVVEVHRSPARPGRGTNWPITQCRPRPGTSISPSWAGCTDSGPSGAARRLSSATGSAKRRCWRGRTEDSARRLVDACWQTRTILPATATIEQLCAVARVDAETPDRSPHRRAGSARAPARTGASDQRNGRHRRDAVRLAQAVRAGQQFR